MSDQARRDRRMLELLILADVTLTRVTNEAQCGGSVVALEAGSYFTPQDIAELKTAHLSITRVLEQALALRQRAERSEP